MASNTNQQITTFDGRIDIQAIHSPSQFESFDFDSMYISGLDIEDGLHADIISECWDRTPLHVAVTHKHADVVKCFTDQAGMYTSYLKDLFFFTYLLNRVVTNTENAEISTVNYRQHTRNLNFSNSSALKSDIFLGCCYLFICLFIYLFICLFICYIYLLFT